MERQISDIDLPKKSMSNLDDDDPYYVCLTDQSDCDDFVDIPSMKQSSLFKVNTEMEIMDDPAKNQMAELELDKKLDHYCLMQAQDLNLETELQKHFKCEISDKK